MEPPDRKKWIVIALAGMAVALAFMGNFFWTFFQGFRRAQSNGNHGSNVPLLIFGGFFLVMIFAVVFTVVRGFRKFASPNPGGEPSRDPKPWLARPDWAAGKIKSTAVAPVKFLMLWSVLALAISAPAVWHIPQELQKGNQLVLVVLVFPIAAFCLIGWLVVQWRSRRRFGECYFEMASIPGALGGTLEGLIQTGARLRLEHGLHLKLTCICRTVSGSGNNQSVIEKFLWQDEKIFKNEADLPEPEPGRSGIPVFFKLPVDQPGCYARGGESVLWRLEAKARLSGPNFSATFEVPVFNVAGAVAAADEPDPTAAWQMPIGELRRDEHSKIRVGDGPGGREFYFPAARNPGTALMFTFFLVVWSGVLWLMIDKHAPVLFPVVFGFFEIFIFWGCLSIWLKSSRVTVNPSGVTAQSRWLVFARTRRFNEDEIVSFDSKVSMNSGNQSFQDLRLILRGNKKTTLADGVPTKPEADWLAQQMTRALGR